MNEIKSIPIPHLIPKEQQVATFDEALQKIQDVWNQNSISYQQAATQGIHAKIDGITVEYLAENYKTPQGMLQDYNNDVSLLAALPALKKLGYNIHKSEWFNNTLVLDRFGRDTELECGLREEATLRLHDCGEHLYIQGSTFNLEKLLADHEVNKIEFRSTYRMALYDISVIEKIVKLNQKSFELKQQRSPS